MAILIKNKVPTTLYQVYDNEGKLMDPNHKITLSNEQLKHAFYLMNLSRIMDKKMLVWQRAGKMLNFAPNLGEEALQVGMGMGLNENDWFCPTFRSGALMLYRGVKPEQLLLYWNGNENGSKIEAKYKTLPINITIGAQYSHAAGLGYMLHYKKLPNVAVTMIGDGGTAEGEFYEAMNIASIQKWNSVFCINNNQFAISTRTKLESAVSDLSTKAIAVNIPRIRVDGNDLIASYEAMHEAANYARSGNGPVLIEFFSWRQGPHTTSDDPSIYRTKEEEAEAMKSDPVKRLRNFLFDRGILTPQQEEEMVAKIEQEVQAAYEVMVSKTPVTLDEVFDYNYEKLTPDLARQKAEAKKYFKD